MNQNPYFNYYQRPQQMMQMPYILKGYPVSSLEEAKASNIDFDGSVFFFPDLTNKKIYTKQILMDGTLAFNTYDLTENVEKIQEPQPEYATKAELQEVIAMIKSQNSGERKREMLNNF